MLTQSREDYHRLAQAGAPVPLTCELLADIETPLSAYWKLAHDEPFSFLLESVTGGDQLARYSIIGIRPSRVFKARGEQVDEALSGESTHVDGDPLAWILKHAPHLLEGEDVGLPRFCGGAVGMIAYDYVRRIERLPDQTQDDLDLDELAFMIIEQVIVFDHVKNVIQIIFLANGSPEAYAKAEAEAQRITERLRAPLPPLPNEAGDAPEFTSNMTQAEYEASVQKAIDYIRAGDAFQVVPSLRLSAEISAHPITVYRALRSLNPSPYMMLFRFGSFDIVGASPELLVGLQHGTARVRPIAGTRPRGATPEEDRELERELLADEKERAEHVMLVDLGRNDLGRVSEYGTVKVGDFMTVERYSHVMHIVSQVTGRLSADYDAARLIRASFPAGTVSGAPKVRAMEIIDELEPTRRGIYAGAVGYASATGDLDMAIAIRTMLLKDGKAHIQAGAGVVFDSVPEREYQECLNKARALIRAVEMAQQGLD